MPSNLSREKERERASESKRKRESERERVRERERERKQKRNHLGKNERMVEGKEEKVKIYSNHSKTLQFVEKRKKENI